MGKYQHHVEEAESAIRTSYSNPDVRMAAFYALIGQVHATLAVAESIQIVGMVIEDKEGGSI